MGQGTERGFHFALCFSFAQMRNQLVGSGDLQPAAEAFVMVIPILICLLGMNVKSTDALKAWIMGSAFG